VATERKPTLFEKVCGCIAASNCAVALAAPTEGWHSTRIQERYGILDRMVARTHVPRRGSSSASGAPTGSPRP
jgi:ADP-ribosylglycohydrolase